MTPHVEIVGKQARSQLTRHALGRLTRPDRALAEAILRILHDRHVGITPELSADLVKLVRAAQRGQSITGEWAPLLARLGHAYLSSQGEAPLPSAGRGPLLGTGTYYFLSKVVEPLVARAGNDIGEIYLFSDHDTGPAPKGLVATYAAYRRRLHTRLRQLLGDEELSELFWSDRALTLAAISRPRGAGAAETADLPEADVVGLAHLHRLRPQLQRRQQRRRLQRRSLAPAPRLRPLRSRNEGGVDGIHLTRRLADLPSMLLSELTNPRELLLERLLSSGFLALRRPPEQVQRRDVLVAGIMPCLSWLETSGRFTMSLALARAAWLDCMLRLSVWLLRTGLQRSELLWIESDRLGQLRSSRCLLREIPTSQLSLCEEPTAALRTEMLTSHGWLPGYLDENLPVRAPPHTLHPQPGDSTGEQAVPLAVRQRRQVQRMLRWAASAWRSLRDHPSWQHDDSSDRRRPSPDDGRLQWREFGSVQLMLFLPRVDEQVWAPGLGSLLPSFGMPLGRGCNLVVTSVPRFPAERAEELDWLVRARGKRRRVAGPAGKDAEQGEVPQERIAARLESTWLDLIFSEMLGG